MILCYNKNKQQPVNTYNIIMEAKDGFLEAENWMDR